MNSLKKQKGVALFMTLLIVSIATLLATEMWFKNNLDIARQFNNRASMQAQHYSRGMIFWAKDVLRIDYEDSANVDTNSDAWTQEITGIPVEEALISGRITDLTSKFNINNLWIDNNLHEPSYQLLVRLLENMQLESSLADKLVDWIDPDVISRANGAEDITYSTRKPYLKTAGQYIEHISELRLVDGFNLETYERLKPYLTVLPIQSNQPSKININTAPLLILKSLDDKIQINEARALYSDGQANFTDLAQFFEHGAVRNAFKFDENKRDSISNLIDTKSTWLHAQTQVLMDEAIYKRYALLHRNSSIARVVQWSLTSYE